MQDEMKTTDEMPHLIVSACLMGLPCRYDGGAMAATQLQAWVARQGAAIICPECAGGLPTPRPPAEIIDGDGFDVLDGRARVRTIEGRDVTDEFLAGAQATLQLATQAGATVAILTERSPSCGVQVIHDGHFQGGLKAGCGVTAAILRRHGLTVLSEEQWEDSNLLR